MPGDELPIGIACPEALTQERRAAERSALQAERLAKVRNRPTAEQARHIGRMGGLARAAKARELKSLDALGLRGRPEALAPYLDDANAFARAECARMAAVVGNGVCGSGPSSIIQSAALALAGSRAAYDAGELTLGSRLAESSRQHLAMAHELCHKEALARKGQPGKLDPALAAFFPDHAGAGK